MDYIMGSGEMMKTEFERVQRVRLPYDMRSDEPGKNYGIHGLDVFFILKGPLGAVQFFVNFPIFLPSVDTSGFRETLNSINGYDVGYHSPKPMYDDQPSMDCDVLGGKCYYDGSGLRADEWVRELFSITGERIDEHVWKKLEQEYKVRFEL